MAKKIYAGTGHRKSSIARVRMTEGTGKITVNGKDVNEYLPFPTLVMDLCQPLDVTDTRDKFDIDAKVSGGGFSGQAGAVRHGIARALLAVDPDFRDALKKAGLLTRDPRMKERRKPGLKKARKAAQFSKR